VIIPQKGQIPSTLTTYIFLMLFCVPFTMPITDPCSLCIPSLKSPGALPNMSVWLISSGNLIALGTGGNTNLDWLAGQPGDVFW